MATKLEKRRRAATFSGRAVGLRPGAAVGWLGRGALVVAAIGCSRQGEAPGPVVTDVATVEPAAYAGRETAVPPPDEGDGVDAIVRAELGTEAPEECKELARLRCADGLERVELAECKRRASEVRVLVGEPNGAIRCKQELERQKARPPARVRPYL